MRTFTILAPDNLSTRIKADDFNVEADGTLVLYNYEANSEKSFTAEHQVAAFHSGHWTRVVADSK